MDYLEEVFTNITVQTRLHIKNVEFDSDSTSANSGCAILNGCVNLGQLFNLTEPRFPYVLGIDYSVSQEHCRD